MLQVVVWYQEPPFAATTELEVQVACTRDACSRARARMRVLARVVGRVRVHSCIAYIRLFFQCRASDAFSFKSHIHRELAMHTY